MTHGKLKKNNFQALSISQIFMESVFFSAVFIMNNLKGMRYKSGTMDTKS
jgi:hypothetical protein